MTELERKVEIYQQISVIKPPNSSFICLQAVARVDKGPVIGKPGAMVAPAWSGALFWVLLLGLRAM